MTVSAYEYADDTRPKQGTDRAFGLTFAAVFVLIALWPLLRGEWPRLWAVAIAMAFGAAGLLFPAALAPLNRAWIRFGAVLHRVISPLVMGAIFFLVVTPIAYLMRLAGKDPLALRLDPAATTYWIKREPPGPEAASMQQQF